MALTRAASSVSQGRGAGGRSMASRGTSRTASAIADISAGSSGESSPVGDSTRSEHAASAAVHARTAQTRKQLDFIRLLVGRKGPPRMHVAESGEGL